METNTLPSTNTVTPGAGPVMPAGNDSNANKGTSTNYLFGRDRMLYGADMPCACGKRIYRGAEGGEVDRIGAGGCREHK